MGADDYGSISPSIYETGRLVALAPWLTGHAERLRFLFEAQRSDGLWGSPDGYALVPTLSATEAVLSVLRRPERRRVHEPDHGELVVTANRGLRALSGYLDGSRRFRLPDTVAVELVVPALIADINAHLERLRTEPLAGLDANLGIVPLVAPPDADGRLLARVRSEARHGRELPAKLLHSLEVIGPSARQAPYVHPVGGAVACSPAATAAWLGDRVPSAAERTSVDYLEAVQRQWGGAVPAGTPVGLFERAWVVIALCASGMRRTFPPELAATIEDAIGEHGASAGPGLPPDADDTAVALHALVELGRPRSPECLLDYRADDHFHCFPGERTSSTTTNAHVLQAIGACQATEPRWQGAYRSAMAMVSTWLREQQQSDGSWTDKWHASPYYATACSVSALVRYGVGAADIVEATTEWVLGTQREDGSWGHWTGTHEETAYAVQILLHAKKRDGGDTIRQAVVRGCAFLLRPPRHHLPLWHDKDLYAPIRIVQAEGLAALHLALSDRHVAAKLRGTPQGEERAAVREADEPR
jgi:hypothetical protein